MTPEQLDAIEKLARDPKSAAFHDLMARQTIPLVKALREALAALEWQAAMTKALSESQERLAQEVKEARAEVERLREALQEIAEGDCYYGDNCPSNAGTRHGTCTECKARQALKEGES